MHELQNPTIPIHGDTLHLYPVATPFPPETPPFYRTQTKCLFRWCEWGIFWGTPLRHDNTSSKFLATRWSLYSTHLGEALAVPHHPAVWQYSEIELFDNTYGKRRNLDDGNGPRGWQEEKQQVWRLPLFLPPKEISAQSSPMTCFYFSSPSLAAHGPEGIIPPFLPHLPPHLKWKECHHKKAPSFNLC